MVPIFPFHVRKLQAITLIKRSITKREYLSQANFVSKTGLHEVRSRRHEVENLLERKTLLYLEKTQA